MIRWLLRWFGYEDQEAHLRSLVTQLQQSGPESSVMIRAKRALERHDRREQAIAHHKAEAEEHVTKCKQEREEHKSTILAATQGLERVRRRETERLEQTQRLGRKHNNPFLAAMQARKRAEG